MTEISLPEDPETEQRETQRAFPLFAPFFLHAWEAPTLDPPGKYYRICEILGVPGLFCWHDYLRFRQNAYGDFYDNERYTCCRPVDIFHGMRPQQSIYDVIGNNYLTSDRESIEVDQEMGVHGVQSIIGVQPASSGLGPMEMPVETYANRKEQALCTSNIQLQKSFERPFLSEPLRRTAFIAGRDQTLVPNALRNKHYRSFEWGQSHHAVKDQLFCDWVCFPRKL